MLNMNSGEIIIILGETVSTLGHALLVYQCVCVCVCVSYVCMHAFSSYGNWRGKRVTVRESNPS